MTDLAVFTNEHCDFCYSTNVIHHFPCLDFDESKNAGVVFLHPTDHLPVNVVLASSDYWAACPACKELVEKEDVLGLVKRAIEEDEEGERLSITSKLKVAIHLRQTYEMFFKLRIRDGKNRVVPVPES